MSGATLQDRAQYLMMRQTRATTSVVGGGTMSTGDEYAVAADGSFTAPLELTYPYSRTVGPVLSRFFTALSERRIEGTVGSDGRVFVPPAEFDPVTGDPCSQWVTVADIGTVVSWAWDPTGGFAWGLVTLDGADVPMLHRVSCGDERPTIGDRVRARWSAEPSGSILDIEAFEVIG
jgi:uncharacterized OB-fold protein